MQLMNRLQFKLKLKLLPKVVEHHQNRCILIASRIPAEKMKNVMAGKSHRDKINAMTTKVVNEVTKYVINLSMRTPQQQKRQKRKLLPIPLQQKALQKNQIRAIKDVENLTAIAKNSKSRKNRMKFQPKQLIRLKI